MAVNYDRVDKLTRRYIVPKLYSQFIQTKPFLYLLAGQNVVGLDKLGDPDNAVWFGRRSMGPGQRAEVLGSSNHVIRYQTEETDAPEGVGLDGSTPTATKFSDELTEMAATHWTDFWASLRIHKTAEDNAKGDLAVQRVVEEAVAMGMNRKLKWFADRIINGSLTEAEQDEIDWTDFLGVDHVVSDGSTDSASYKFYARKDRTGLKEGQLRATVLTAASLIAGGHLADSKPTLRLFRKIRLINALSGLANKDPQAGTCIMTTSELWELLADEAEGDHRIDESVNQMPEVLRAIGSQYPVIHKDNFYISYDPGIPEGTAYALTLDSWAWEVQQGNNFRTEPWTAKWRTEEGGGKYRWTTCHAKTRLTCHEPHLQTKVTGLTVDGS